LKNPEKKAGGQGAAGPPVRSRAKPWLGVLKLLKLSYLESEEMPFPCFKFVL